MFLCGNQIINDYHFETLIACLLTLGAVRGQDYFYAGEKKIILRPTAKILSSRLIYRHEILSLTWNQKYIGRKIDHKNRKITDYVFDTAIKFGRKGEKWGPITAGWTYDFDHVSVVEWIMRMIEEIPLESRKNPLYVSTFFCSKIDSCNDTKLGLIEGRWNETFSGGRHPNDWRNASEVFRSRIEGGGPVKYGQCWLLADLLVGILRFLGISSHSVKVNRCIIDIHDLKGMDLIIGEDLTFKKAVKKGGARSHSGHRVPPNIFNPLGIVTTAERCDPPDSATKITLFSKKLPQKKINKKGALFALEKDCKIDDRDFYDLNHYSCRENSNWNFHVWTEFSYDKENYILDPTPLHGVDPLSFKPYRESQRWNAFDGLRFFGPIKVSSVKENTPDPFLPATSRYLFSCVNGQVRYWTFYIQKKRRILYLSNVDYRMPYVVGKSSSGETIDLTCNYRQKENFYDFFHKDHPIFLRIKENDFSKIHIKFSTNLALERQSQDRWGGGPHAVGYPSRAVLRRGEVTKTIYVIQLSFLFGNQVLYLHRESTHNLSPETFSFLRNEIIKKYRLSADRMTITIYDLSNKKCWSQCIKV